MTNRCESQWQVSTVDKDLLWWYSGGHPYLAELILCHSFPHQSVAKGAEHVAAAIFEFYQHLQRLLQEDQIFRGAAANCSRAALVLEGRLD